MTSDLKSPQILLHLLCNKISGLNDNAVVPYYQTALSTLGSGIAFPQELSEFEVAERIKKKLARHGREKDAAVFSELHRKLQSKGDVIKDRASVLYLLYKLSEDKTKQGRVGSATPSFFHTHATHHPYHGTSTPHPWGHTTPQGATALTSLHHTTSSVGTGGTSGISSIHGTLESREPTPQSYMPTPGYTPYFTGGGQPQQNTRHPPPLSTGKQLLSTLKGYHSDTSTGERTLTQQSMTRSGVTGRGLTRDGDNTSFDIPESVLVRELVYILQGIEGTYIKFDKLKEAYKVSTEVGVSKSTRQLVTKLAECGWLYNKIRKYADSRSTDRAFGLVGQSFCAALHQELTEYYRLLTVLEAQLQQEEDQGVHIQGGGLTLRKMAVWTHEPTIKLKAIAALVDVCQGKKGGALASAIHSHIQHGDPYVRSLIKHCLTLVAQPIFSTITRWIYDGELEDTYHEFFVASDPMVKDDRLWHEKYNIRKGMVPSFLTEQQANKILLTGKSINFLRHVCHDRTNIRIRDVVKEAETSQVESIFLQDTDTAFQRMIDTIYKETSHHLLEVLHTKYKFMEHLKAMRRYLLLGQGDFIRHLMDLLEEDLAKPATQLYLHNLTGILETAIRATNAQYDDPEILSKVLDVRLLEVSPGDTGWDVFSLDYRVKGPIRTVFTPECVVMYLRVFNFLWRAKRMEYILAGIWKGQMSNSRMLKSVPELRPIFHQCHMIGCEMVHFVQQVQYYINFEVLECSWDELLHKVHEAEDLDHVIAAHQVFLDTIITRALLDNSSNAILTQLRTIFDLIIKFQGIQDVMYQSADEEIIQRQMYEKAKKDRTQKEEWGLTDAEEKAEEKRRKEFRQSLIPNTGSQLRVLSEQYQRMVRQFLVMLTGHTDLSLRFLSFRLDFNEHYKAKEPKLRTPGSQAHKTKKRV